MSQATYARQAVILDLAIVVVVSVLYWLVNCLDSDAGQ
jgi:hypothetical protein